MVIPNLKFSKMGGGYSGLNFGHPKSEVFQNGGGGYSRVNFGHPKSEVFQNGGGVFRSKLWSGKFGPKFTVQPETCLCITVVSHILRMWRLIIVLRWILEVLFEDIKCVKDESWNLWGPLLTLF